jgi:antirestriction protein
MRNLLKDYEDLYNASAAEAASADPVPQLTLRAREHDFSRVILREIYNKFGSVKCFGIRYNINLNQEFSL